MVIGIDSAWNQLDDSDKSPWLIEATIAINNGKAGLCTEERCVVAYTDSDEVARGIWAAESYLADSND